MKNKVTDAEIAQFLPLIEPVARVILTIHDLDADTHLDALKQAGREGIWRAVKKKGKTVSKPYVISAIKNSVLNEKDRILRERGQSRSTDANTGRKTWKTAVRFLSFDSTEPNDEGILVSELTPGDLSRVTDDPWAATDAKLTVDKALAELGPSEERVIQLRYFGDMTVREVAEATGISKSEISRIEQKAMAKMRNALGSGTKVHP
jgi:RNA polymerase sigma factor (sigma-70 family)